MDSSSNSLINLMPGSSISFKATNNQWVLCDSFINMLDIQDNGQGSVTVQQHTGSPANLNVTGTSTLSGKTVIISQVDNLPFQVAGLGGQLWFYSGGGQNNGAVIRGIEDNYGIVLLELIGY